MSRVRRYYDRNTWKFLLTGRGRAIHRELWAPGVKSPRAAVEHAHALIAGEVDRRLGGRPGRVLDVGCGVGAAAFDLAARRPVEVVGVSISPVQIEHARRFAATAGALRGSVRFEVADFHALPAGLGSFALAYAIEAFVHADSPARFFAGVAPRLEPGAALVVIDDVRTGDPADPWLDDVRTGWHAGTLASGAEITEAARGAGLELVEERDLSPLQRLGRPRDRLIRVLQPALRRLRTRSVWAEALVGGDALQRAHQRGLLAYRLLRLVKQ